MIIKNIYLNNKKDVAISKLKDLSLLHMIVARIFLVSIKRITIFHLLVAIERIITLSYGNIETHLIFKPHGILLKFIQYIPYSTNNKGYKRNE